MHRRGLPTNLRQALGQVPHRLLPLLDHPQQVQHRINHVIIAQDLFGIKLLGKQPHLKQLVKPPSRPMGHLPRHQQHVIVTRTL